MFRIMFLAGLTFTILFLLLSILLFIKNDVAKLMGDVTGPAHKKPELKPKQSMMAAIHEAQGRPVGEVFETEELTTVLAEGDQQTTVLTEELTTVLAEDAATVPDGEEKALDILTGGEKPLPDIFEVEDQATVVHTDESIT